MMMGYWSKEDIIAFVFLFFGCLIIISFLKTIIKLLSYQWKEGEFSGLTLIKIFTPTIISFILMLVFIFLIMPLL
jgi:hypothetical protein